MPLNKYPKEVVWAAEYIMSVVGRRKLITEERISVMRDGEEITFGSMDAYCKGNLFDLKTGLVRDYRQQMAAYALGVMQKYKEKKLTCHLVYSKTKEVKEFSLTRKEAEDIVYAIVDSVNDPTRSPWPCEYCIWCGRREQCTALKHFAYTIGGQVEAMKHINLNAPLEPAVRKRLLCIANAVEDWSENIREKVNKE
jgi:CRISPR/Cas system-associated exonuclease Cas4 (RecB family)